MRRLILYLGVVVVLGAALIGGIFWAKQRSLTVSVKNGAPAQQQPSASNNPQEQKKPEDKPAVSRPQPQTGAVNPTPSANKPATTPVPSQVPQTGPSSIGLSLIGLMAIVFSASIYIQTRRRLQALR